MPMFLRRPWQVPDQALVSTGTVQPVVLATA
jgi:hypothetical protein